MGLAVIYAYTYSRMHRTRNGLSPNNPQILTIRRGIIRCSWLLKRHSHFVCTLFSMGCYKYIFIYLYICVCVYCGGCSMDTVDYTDVCTVRAWHLCAMRLYFWPLTTICSVEIHAQSFYIIILFLHLHYYLHKHIYIYILYMCIYITPSTMAEESTSSTIASSPTKDPCIIKIVIWDLSYPCQIGNKMHILIYRIRDVQLHYILPSTQNIYIYD